MRISDFLYFYAIENVSVVSIFFTKIKNIEQPKRIKCVKSLGWSVKAISKYSKDPFEISMSRLRTEH